MKKKINSFDLNIVKFQRTCIGALSPNCLLCFSDCKLKESNLNLGVLSPLIDDDDDTNVDCFDSNFELDS